MTLVAVLDWDRLPADWPDRLRAVRARDAVDVYVLRAKTLSAQVQWERAREVVAWTAPRPVLVADRADVARAAGAAGVHLPADGLPIAAVRGWWPAALISRAVHGADELESSEPDWWVFGHLFPTRSKPGLAPRGPGGANDIMGRVRAPVVGIGGVTAATAREAGRAGLAGVAVVDAIWLADDSGAATAAIRAAFLGGREEGQHAASH
jgi:thiamine-phosphate diphosphorylase